MKTQWISYLISGLFALLATGCTTLPVAPDFKDQNTSALTDSRKFSQKAETYYLVFDGSSSMTNAHYKWKKIEVAREITRRLNATIPASIPLAAATRAFGPAQKDGARNSLIYGFTGFAASAMNAETDKITLPGGVTPIGEVLEAASIDLQAASGRIAMIIISDGEETESETSLLESAERLKSLYGDRLCIYTIHVGNEATGRALLEKISKASGCGFSTTGDTVLSTTGMAGFVERVFFEPVYDRDGDGVVDKNDKCPDTPAGVKVDASGCPIDSDRDGVSDYMDKCPDTPAGVKVDASGCPIDSDRDGVYDYMDKCPDTPAGVKVDASGCPIDSDRDGVSDYMDKCPDTPLAAKVDTSGCWQIGTIYFDNDKAVIKESEYSKIEEVVEVMKKNSGLKIQVVGHTSSTATPAYNMTLSTKRAKNVAQYLVSKGLAADRIAETAFGLTRPAAANDTEEGAALNRRVVIIPMR